MYEIDLDTYLDGVQDCFNEFDGTDTEMNVRIVETMMVVLNARGQKFTMEDTVEQFTQLECVVVTVGRDC